MPVNTYESKPDPAPEVGAAIGVGAKPTLAQKRAFIRHAMLTRGPEWVRDDLRVPPDAVSVDHWAEDMVERAFVAALTANQ